MILRRKLWLRRVLAMGLGNLPAVQVWNAKTGHFSSRTGLDSDPLTLGRPNLDPYLSGHGLCRVQLDPIVQVFRSAFRVSLFIVTFTYATVIHKMLTLVCHSVFLKYWPP